MDGPSENVLCVIIPFDDNLFKRAVGAVTLYSVGILGGGATMQQVVEISADIQS